MLNVLQIARMTVHNGPGLRTNVHFMGCPLNCEWCSTPESKRSRGGLGYEPSRCIGCGTCVGHCPAGALAMENGGVKLNRELCTECFQCVPECYSRTLWRYGTEWTVEALADEILKDRLFFENSHGGITFSGGEPLLHADDEMEELYRIVKSAGINIGVDTSGYVPWAHIERLLPYIDFFLWDIKQMDPERHRRLTGVDPQLIFENLKRLDQSGASLTLRYPVIPGRNDSTEDFAALADFVGSLNHVEELHLLPFHHLGKNRYLQSGLPYPMEGVPLLSREKLEKWREYLQQRGITARIVG